MQPPPRSCRSGLCVEIAALEHTQRFDSEAAVLRSARRATNSALPHQQRGVYQHSRVSLLEGSVQVGMTRCGVPVMTGRCRKRSGWEIDRPVPVSFHALIRIRVTQCPSGVSQREYRSSTRPSGVLWAGTRALSAPSDAATKRRHSALLRLTSGRGVTGHAGPEVGTTCCLEG
jgi:hypothetical protein